jgi:glycosyltransferase involved in cell wall biosynthesis
MNLEVIMPSKRRVGREDFLRRAIKSIEVQNESIFTNTIISIVVDPGDDIKNLVNDFDVEIKILESDRKGQIAALNYGIRAASASHLAFLEDDDWWDPNFLVVGGECLDEFGPELITQNQLEVYPNGDYARVFDFPTPSTWIASRKMVVALDGFSKDSKWHTDNEFLGRVYQQGFSRIHLVERSAPLTLELAQQVRPWVANILKTNQHNFEILAHQYPEPLVFRQIHPEQGTEYVKGSFSTESQLEYQKLKILFGQVPW